jgi:hypothetical protein
MVTSEGVTWGGLPERKPWIRLPAVENLDGTPGEESLVGSRLGDLWRGPPRGNSWWGLPVVDLLEGSLERTVRLEPPGEDTLDGTRWKGSPAIGPFRVTPGGDPWNGLPGGNSP